MVQGVDFCMCVVYDVVLAKKKKLIRPSTLSFNFLVQNQIKIRILIGNCSLLEI